MDVLERARVGKGRLATMRQLPSMFMAARSSESGIGIGGVRCHKNTVTVYCATGSTHQLVVVDLPRDRVSRLMMLAIVDAAMSNDIDPRHMFDGSTRMFAKVPTFAKVSKSRLGPQKNVSALDTLSV